MLIVKNGNEIRGYVGSLPDSCPNIIRKNYCGQAGRHAGRESSMGYEKRKALIKFIAFFMPFVYVIESLSDQFWYTGIALNVVNRLKEHNSGKNRFTKGHRPWKIIFAEEHPDWKAARKKEKYLKTAAGKKWLEKYLAEKGGDSGFPA